MCFCRVKRKSWLKPAKIPQFFLKPRRRPRITRISRSGKWARLISPRKSHLKRTKSFLHRRPVVLDVFAVDVAIGTDGRDSAMLSLSSTLLICKQLRLSDAHAREALALASASVLVSPAPRPHRYRCDSSSPVQNQSRADPRLALDHRRRLPGYSVPANG